MEKKYNRVPFEVRVKILDLLRSRVKELQETRPMLTKLAPEIGAEVGFPTLSPGTLAEIRTAAGVTWEPRSGPASGPGKLRGRVQELERRLLLVESEGATFREAVSIADAARLKVDATLKAEVSALRTLAENLCQQLGLTPTGQPQPGYFGTAKSA